MFGHEFCIGLDIGQSALRLCQLRRRRGRLVLEYLVEVPLAPSIWGARGLDDPEALTEALVQAREGHQTLAGPVALSLSCQNVVMKRISLPRMTPKELAESLAWEAGQHLPYALSDAYVDAKIIRDALDDQQPMDVLLVGTRRRLVDDLADAVRAAGFDPLICDLEPCALAAMLAQSYGAELPGVVVCIDVGGTSTGLYVLRDGVPESATTLTVGADMITERLQQALGTSWDAAKACKHGLGSDKARSMPQAAVLAASAATQSLADALSEPLMQLVRGQASRRVFAVGGGARTAGLLDALSRISGCQFERVNPLRQIHIRSEAVEAVQRALPTSAVAVGLALRYPGD